MKKESTFYLGVAAHYNCVDATSNWKYSDLRTAFHINRWHVFHYWYPESTEIIWLNSHQIPEIAYIASEITKFSKYSNFAKDFIEFSTFSTFARDVFRKYHYFASEEEVRKYASYARMPPSSG